MNRILCTIVIALGLFFLLNNGPIAHAQGSAGNFGLDTAAGAAGLKTNGDVTEIIGNVIGTGLSLISVLFFILMIYGGILWMTARGADEQATKAKETIFAAVIGIIIVMAAYAITNFVFKSVQGTGNTTAATGGGAQQTLNWCLTDDNTCVEGAGGACPGQTYATEDECSAAVGGGAGTPPDSCEVPEVCLLGEEAEDYCACLNGQSGNDMTCATVAVCTNFPIECQTDEVKQQYTGCLLSGNPSTDCLLECTL